MESDPSATLASRRRLIGDDRKHKDMFRIRRTLPSTPNHPPNAIEWWERPFQSEDLAEQITRLRRQLGLALAAAERSSRPLFLRALGRDIDAELRQLADRVVFALGRQPGALEERCRILEEMIRYYSDVAVPLRRPFELIELSDCAREAVAGLSGDLPLVLRIAGEPYVLASRRLATALFEVSIFAASARPTDEIEVILPPCSESAAEFRVVWPKATTSKGASLENERDKSRFLALAIAYAVQIGGTLSRGTATEEVLVVRIPIATHAENNTPQNLPFDRDVIAEATAFCMEG